MVTPFPAVRRKRLVVLQRRPELRRRRQHVFEGAGHHANDYIETVIEGHLLSRDEFVSGKAAPPQLVTQDDDEIVARLIFLFEKRPPELGANTEHRK